jgi:membrane-bound ClpP family serine protease
MIQRIQSLWLLFAAAFDAVTFRFPFYRGDWTKDTIPYEIDLNAQTSIWLTILTAIAGLLAFVTIFLFDNRKLQLRLSYLGIFLTVILLVLYFLELQNFTTGTVAIWCIFYFAILGCFILAARGIWKDQKIIKSMDRLR